MLKSKLITDTFCRKARKLCPKKPPACLPFSRRRWHTCVPAALPKASSPCRMTSTPRFLKTCCRRLKANENPAGHLRISLARVRRREIVRRRFRCDSQPGQFIPPQREKHLIAPLALDEAAIVKLGGLPVLPTGCWSVKYRRTTWRSPRDRKSTRLNSSHL